MRAGNLTVDGSVGYLLIDGIIFGQEYSQWKAFARVHVHSRW